MGKRIIDEDSVLDAALDEFTAKNYEEASVNTIIRNAGISKGSFYYRFENKYALYLYLLKECSRMKWDYINSETSPEDGNGSGNDIFDLFMLQAKTAAGFAKKHPKFHKLSKMLSKEKGTRLYDEVLTELGQENDTILTGLISQAAARGDFSDRYSAEFLEKVITHLFMSFDEIFFKDEDMELDRVLLNLEDFIFFMKNGLAPGAADQPAPNS